MSEAIELVPCLGCNTLCVPGLRVEELPFCTVRCLLAYWDRQDENLRQLQLDLRTEEAELDDGGL